MADHQDLYTLAEKARGHLAREASQKNLNIRRILGHAQLLDTLVAELTVLDFFSEEDCPQDMTVVDGAKCNCDAEGAEDIYLNSEPDSSDSSDSDWDSDSDTESESESDSESDSDPDSEWQFSEDFNPEVPEACYYSKCCDDLDAYVYAESAALDWAEREFWHTQK